MQPNTTNPETTSSRLLTLPTITYSTTKRKKNPFIIAREDHSLSDPLRGIASLERAIIGPSNKLLILSHFHSVVKENMDIYWGCHPGPSNSYANMQLEETYQIFQRGDHCSLKLLHSTWLQLEYRFKAMELADRIVEFLDLMQQLPCILDVEVEEFKRSEEYSELSNETSDSYAIREILRNGIFAEPSMEQGRRFRKPDLYLGAVMDHLDKEEIDKAISNLLELKNEAKANFNRRKAGEKKAGIHR